MPFWEPIIGSSFDAIGAQRAGWANTNLNTASANIARANAAEQASNSWLARMQQIDQERGNAQAAADASARNFEEGQRQFDVGTQLAKDQQAGQNLRIAAEDRRTAAGQAAITERNDLATAKALAKINAEGNYYAQRYAQVDMPRRTATEKYNQLSSAVDAIDSQLQPIQAKLDAKQELTPEEDAQRTLLTRQRRELEPMVKDADKIRTKHDNAYDRLLNTMTPKGYEVDPESAAVVHVDSNKRWSYRNPSTFLGGNGNLQPNQPAPVVPSGPRFSGFAQPPAVQPVPTVPSQPAPIRVKSVTVVNPAPAAPAPSGFVPSMGLRAAADEASMVPPAAPQFSAIAPPPEHDYSTVPVGAPETGQASPSIPGVKPAGLSDEMWAQMNAPGNAAPAAAVAPESPGPLTPIKWSGKVRLRDLKKMDDLSDPDLTAAAKQLGINVYYKDGKFFKPKSSALRFAFGLGDEELTRRDVQDMVYPAAQAQRMNYEPAK